MAIYITKDLYLSGDLTGTDLDPNNPIVGWHNALEVGSVDAEYEEVDHPATNVQSATTIEWWTSSEDTDQQSFGMQVSPTEINYCGIAGHNLAGATIQLQRRDDPGDLWTNVGDPFIQGDNHAIMIWFQSVFSSAYWNLDITPVAGTAPRIAVIYLGKLLRLQRKIYVGHRPVIFDVDSEFYTGEPEKGGFGGRVIKRETHNLSFKQTQTTPGFVRTYVRPWIEDAVLRPFFFAWRPSMYPEEIAFAWAEKNIKVENMSPNGNMRYDVDAKALAPLR